MLHYKALVNLDYVLCVRVGFCIPFSWKNLDLLFGMYFLNIISYGIKIK